MVRRFGVAILLLGGLVGSTYGQAPEPFNTKDGVAIKGYDPVAYFTEERPVQGDTTHVYRWQNVEWLFNSAANRDAFAENPTTYAPQFGGYCAWAASRNYTADTDPTVWTIDDGKLYLNYNKRVQGDWSEEQAENIQKGHVNWPELRKGLQEQ